MPLYDNGDNTSRSNPSQPLLDFDALRAMKPEQTTQLLLDLLGKSMAMVEGLKNRVEHLERFHSNARPPVREVIGGEGIEVTHDEEKVLVQIDEDELQEMMVGGGGGGSPPTDNIPICSEFGEEVELGDGTEGADAVDATGFTHDGENGCTFWVVTRVFYDHTASAPELKAFVRPISFDRNGRLCQVGIEDDYIVDTPEAC